MLSLLENRAGEKLDFILQNWRGNSPSFSHSKNVKKELTGGFQQIGIGLGENDFPGLKNVTVK
jgi:hypothetical protein